MGSTPSAVNRLPMLTAHGKGQEVLFQAYVQSYVIGTRGCRMAGRWAYPLYWVSLVGMRGQGTTLQGIFARLVANTPRQISLSDVGDVQLAHHHPSLSSLGYTLHWNFEQTEIAPQKDLHAIVESRMLTCVDPIRGSATFKRGRGSSNGEGTTLGKKGKPVGGRASLSTASGSAAQLGASEVAARERSPLFLLFAQADTPERRAASHLAFLDQRVPWPLLPEWGQFLWKRGLETGEIEPLTVWNTTGQPDEERRSSPHRSDGAEQEQEQECRPEEEDEMLLAAPITASLRPLFTEAYLCRPRPEKLLSDLRYALRAGELETHHHHHHHSPDDERDDDHENVVGESLPLETRQVVEALA